MKRSLKLFVIAMLVTVMMSVVAFAEKKTGKVEFGRDMVVNGTTVKKGSYKVEIDDQANEMKLLDGKKVVATTKYHVESKQNKNSQTVVSLTRKDGDNLLHGIDFKGESQTYVVGENESQAAQPQQ